MCICINATDEEEMEDESVVDVYVQKDASKSDDFHGETSAGDTDTIEVITDAGGTDPERADGDEQQKDEKS